MAAGSLFLYFNWSKPTCWFPGRQEARVPSSSASSPQWYGDGGFSEQQLAWLPEEALIPEDQPSHLYQFYLPQAQQGNFLIYPHTVPAGQFCGLLGDLLDSSQLPH